MSTGIIQLPYTYGCFVCGAENPAGLRLRFRVEDGEVRSAFTPREPHAGYRGMVHGGVIGAALDEVMFWAAAWPTRAFHVSVDLNIRYARKVEVGAPHNLAARLTRQQRRICFTEAELRDAAGKVCASATGKFFPMPPGEVPLGKEDFYPDASVMPLAEFLKP